MPNLKAYRTKDTNLYELSISLFFSILSVGIIRFYLYARTGFDVSYADINNVTGISLLVLLFPSVLSAFEIVYLNKSRSHYIGFNSLITFLIILFLIACSYIISGLGYWLLSVLAVLGYICLVISVYLFARSFKHTQWAILVVASFLVLIWLVGRVFSVGYHNPLFLENLAIGVTNLDTLFHSSIMQMIKTYGVPSTGLDGLPYLSYHWGSHWLLSRFSILLNTSAISTYNLVYPALFICLYFKASLAFAYDVFRQFSQDTEPVTKNGIKFWLFFMITQIGFLPYSFLSNWAVWDSWIESESYLISLVFFYIFSSIILLAYNKVSTTKNYKSYIFLILTVLLLPLLGLLKISTLIIAIAIVIYLFFKLKLFLHPINNFLLIITLCLSYYIKYITTSAFETEENNNFYLFHFFKSYTLPNWKGAFYYIHYFWTIFYIVLRLQHVELKELKKSFFSNKLVDIEVLIIISLAGLLPASLFRIDGGSAYYFTDIQARVASSFIMAFVLYDSLIANTSNNELRGLSSLLKKYALIIPLIIVLLLSNVFSKFEDSVNANISSRIQFSNLYEGDRGYLQGASANILLYTSGKTSDIYLKLRQLKNIPPEGLRTHPRYIFLKQISLLNNLDRSKKSQLSIYVPHTNEWFWQQSLENIYATPFILPALSGIVSIGGLPKGVNPKQFSTYGYSTYNPSINNEYYRAFPKDSICEHAHRIQLPEKDILIVSTELPGIDTLHCDKNR